MAAGSSLWIALSHKGWFWGESFVLPMLQIRCVCVCVCRDNVTYSVNEDCVFVSVSHSQWVFFFYGQDIRH